MRPSNPTLPSSGSGSALILLWALLLASLVLILQFGLVTRPPLSWLLAGWSRADLVMHAAAFASLAVPAFALFGLRCAVGLSLLAGGALLELLQLMTPERQASVSDVLADAAGIVLGAVIVVGLRRALANRASFAA